MAVARGTGAWLVTLAVLGRPASGQGPVHGMAVAAETGVPVVGAVVVALPARRSVTTERMGRFRLWVEVLPDTLVVTFVGRAPDTLVIRSAPIPPLEVRLAPSPIQLSAIAVMADGRSHDVAPLGTWQLSPEQARGPPLRSRPTSSAPWSRASSGGFLGEGFRQLKRVRYPEREGMRRGREVVEGYTIYDVRRQSVAARLQDSIRIDVVAPAGGHRGAD